MQLSKEHRILFVINPVAGGKHKRDYLNLIKNYFKDNLNGIGFFTLTGKNDAQGLQQAIDTGKPQTIVAVGGDGTVSLVAKQIMGTALQLGILPAGSANGMAKELEIPENIQAALDVIANGVSRQADVIDINGYICLHLSDIGLNAKMIKYFEMGRIRGKLGYAKNALKVLWQRRSIDVTIHLKDQSIVRKAFMVVLANASKYGTGVVINPIGNLCDGIFEVIIIRQLSLFEILRMWFYPKPFDPNKIELLQADSVEMVTKHKVHFQVDGEYLGKVKRVAAKILPAQLNILLPA